MGILKWWCSKFGHGTPILEPYGIIRCERCGEKWNLIQMLKEKRCTLSASEYTPEEPSPSHEE